MNSKVLWIILALFSVLSGAALWQHGYWGIIAPELKNLAGAQVLCDLVISLALILRWMRQDAKAAGRNIWPWFLLTLVAGSFGPLIYLLTRSSASPIYGGKSLADA
jgi:hypothetical protein